MQKYNNLKDLENKAPEMIFQEIEAFLRLNTDHDKFEIAASNLINSMGGEVYIVQGFSDLYNIQFYGDYGLTNIVVTPCKFDDAYILKPYCSYYVITIITNDAGGDIYYIPRDIATKCPMLMRAFKEPRMFSFVELKKDYQC